MRLEIRGLWSPDMLPTPDGRELPPDTEDFSVWVQVAIDEGGRPGSEVFGLTVCSPSALARAEPGAFVTHTLVLERFSWEAVRARIEKVLMHVHAAQTWGEVILGLSGLLKYADEYGEA